MLTLMLQIFLTHTISKIPIYKKWGFFYSDTPPPKSDTPTPEGDGISRSASSVVFEICRLTFKN